ncbi:MAG: HNH endonuclease signature motif containing protein [Synechococcales bacterium]|nr:HNH endonuclease signature motif containing protein [Synechococcales bacterium]
MGIPKSLYNLVQQRANFRCEYCHYPKILSSAPLSIDHLTPKSLGGTDDLDNLALACRRCNECRYNFTTGTDPKTALETPLFNPRRDTWGDHFIGSADATLIIGRTPIGRATCERLDLNDDRRNDKFIQNARKKWFMGRLHPPQDDPRQ